jgi:hypothetical protein
VASTRSSPSSPRRLRDADEAEHTRLEIRIFAALPEGQATLEHFQPELWPQKGTKILAVVVALPRAYRRLQGFIRSMIFASFCDRSRPQFECISATTLFEVL